MKTWSRPDVPSVPGTGPLPVVHETASGERRTLTPAAQAATLYVCGITPYDATHMGHAATYLLFDTIQRAWLDAGYDVTYVQNVTDVDEPLLERAERDGVHWEDLAADQIALFHSDMEALAVLPPAHYVGAVEGIPSDVRAVEAMLASGHAYRLPAGDAVADDAQDVYLDLATTPSFGSVSHLDRGQMLAFFAERGGDPQREGKRDALDPLLWRAHRDGEPHWEGASLGPGRPGWHIECTTIALDHLGGSFDLQGGGDDLVFPHHEMSAVQGEALGMHPFARAYVHQAMVGLDGEKMSKSKGNLVLVSALRRAGVDPRVIRLALLSQHYREAWSWTDAHLSDNEARLARWREAASRGDDAAAAGVVEAVRERVCDDLDTPGALAVLDEWAGRVIDGDAAAEAAGSSGDPSQGTATTASVVAVVDALLGVRLD